MEVGVRMEIQSAQTENAAPENNERQDTVNFKMVTFSLAGKDYGVDIMNIKEIAKADKFTYVPNAAGFVRGVYNLRGDIIPIIDLRVFFHLPSPRPKDGLENLLILHIEDRVYGMVVDKIAKVVGINTENIQPPHPIFGDINIKYISGVVEELGSLYVILDVVRIFSPSQAKTEKEEAEAAETQALAQSAFAEAPAKSNIPNQQTTRGFSDNDLQFIKDGLKALKKFYTTPLNEKWVEKRLAEWGQTRSVSNIQLKDVSDADEFLSNFPSAYNDRLWSRDYTESVKDILPDMPSNALQVWNPGCGKGVESYSLACALKMRYPDAHIKVWANDSDIMAITNAPNLSFTEEEIGDYYKPYTSSGRNGLVFNAAIKDSIVFEYHDVSNGNTLPELDVVVCRDLLSYLPEATQKTVIAEISDRLKKTGLVILGEHETMPEDGWQNVGKDGISAFMRA
jgi:purine-binding chemotaxis protein CheW